MLFTIQIPKMDAAEFTPSGSLLFDAYATGVGVYRYFREDGTEVWEYRSLDEVAKAISLASIAGSHLTIYHPPEFITVDNWKLHSVGMFLTPGVMEGKRVKTRVIAHDKRTIDGLLSGEFTEISMGYWQRPVAVHGQFDGQAYSISQTDIFYNHGSLYEPGGGRLGSTIGPKMDSKDGREWRQHAPCKASQNTDSKPKEKTMIIDFGGVKVDVPDALAPGVKTHLDSLVPSSQVTALTQQLNAANQNLVAVTTSRDSLQGEVATLKATQTQQSTDAAAAAQKEAFQKAFDARMALMASAKQFLPENYDVTGKTDTQIMLDALDVVGAKGNLPADASDLAVKVAYDTAVNILKPQTDAAPAGSPVQAMLTQLGSSVGGRTDTAAGGVKGAYVPPHLRSDGATRIDALDELDLMNAHYNNPKNYVGAAGGAK